jgi:hypothetical protein
MLYQRNCPMCNTLITYKDYKIFWSARKRNSKCKISCYGILIDCNNKICSKCKVEKSKNQFNSCSSSYDKLNSKCKSCRAEERIVLALRDKNEIIFPDNKLCNICKKLKTKDEFHNRKHSKDGLLDICKKCANKKRIIYYTNNISKEKNMPTNKQCPKCKEIKLSQYFYTSKRNIDGLASYCKICDNKLSIQYAKNNREKISKRYREYVKNNIQARIRLNIRNRVSKAIKNKIKPITIENVLGCTRNELMEHLQKQFTNGMTWENYGQWHIDHIIPLASFDLTELEQFKKACHYTNLQPLWAKDNISKSDKILNSKIA